MDSKYSAANNPTGLFVKRFLELQPVPTVSQSSAPRKAMDPPDEPQHHTGSKRRNKWTLGNFFRRKKNVKDGDSSDSSSDVEEKPRSFLGRRRSARKRSEVRNKDNLKNSAPWSGSANSLGSSEGFGSHSSLTRKDRREIMKARVEATRRRSSSEDESIITSKSNSLTKYKSDDSLANKKSRTARTERYMKRISRDEESLSHHSLNRSDVEVHQPPPPAPQNWTASVVYRETSPYVRAVSATPSPVVSPRMQHRVFPTYPPTSPHLPRRSYCEPLKSDMIPIGGYRSSSNINLACNTNGLPSPQMYFYPPIKTSYKQSSLPPPPPPPRDPQRKLLIYNGSEPPAFIRSRSDHSLKQTTPEPLAAASQYQYLADKTPRSRRPIHVVPVTKHEPSPECTMPTPPSWLNVPINESNKTTSFIPEKKVLPEEKHVEVRLRQQSKTPPPPPVRRYSRQSSVSSVDDQEPKRQSNNNLEEALNELEAIYQSLRLGDEDLLDRAERRDLPTAHQQIKLQPSSNENMQDEIVLRRTNRAPPNRRSGIPDPVTDDMAYRRLNQPVQHNNKDRQSGSYLLMSPTLSPVPVQHDPEEPDTTFDDMSYRAIRNANSVRVVETQPPFGIPLTPSPAAPESDYLHVKPTEKYRPTFRPRKTPDVVKDDLAFRNLRKDNGVVVNDKRKRAVRSLSANIMNLMDQQQDDIEKTQSLTCVPNSLQLLLENTEMNPEQIVYKRPPPSWVERANLLDASTETLTQSRANLRSLRNSYLSEDSRPNSLFMPDRNSKVTPIKEDDLSPTSCPLDEDKLEELLSALAKEAHDTSERLGRELERLRDGSRSVEELNKSPTLTQGCEYEGSSSCVAACNDEIRQTGVLTGDVWRRDPNVVSAFKTPPGRHSPVLTAFHPVIPDPRHTMAAPLRTSERARLKAANMQQQQQVASDDVQARSERIAKYKEERRRQLAAQYSASSSSGKDSPAVDGPRRYISREDRAALSAAVSNLSEPLKNIRTTRTSRLRAAAATGAPSQPPPEVKSGTDMKPRPTRKSSKLESSDLSSSSAPSSEVPSREGTPQYVSPSVKVLSSHKSERDKSSKRKSNLNRCLTEEPVVVSSDSTTTDDNTTTTSRRRSKITAASRTISMGVSTAPPPQNTSVRGVQRAASVSQSNPNQPPSSVFQRLQCNVRTNPNIKRNADPSPRRTSNNDVKPTLPINNGDVSKRVDALLARTKEFETRIDRLATPNNNKSKSVNLTSKMSSTKLLSKDVKNNVGKETENTESNRILSENDNGNNKISSTDKISSELKNEHPKLPLNEVIINQVSKLQDCFNADENEKKTDNSEISSSNDEVTFTVTIKSNGHKSDLFIDEEKLLKSASPRVKSPSPPKQKSPTPAKEKSPPVKEKSPPPKAKSPSPPKEKSPSPSKSPVRKISSQNLLLKKPSSLPVSKNPVKIPPVKTPTSPVKSPLKNTSSPIKSPIQRTASKNDNLERKSPEKSPSPVANTSKASDETSSNSNLDELISVLKVDSDLSNGNYHHHHHHDESSETNDEMKSATSSPIKTCESPIKSSESPTLEPRRKSSILKTKKLSLDESTTPISILKHNNNNDSNNISVTVVNAETTSITSSSSSRPQSILKKRSSLEESLSQDEDTNITRRRDEILEQERSFSPEPQGILKPRKSINSINETAKPILKKKSSEDLGDEPRPILKKKTSTDEEMDIEKPRPILKSGRRSVEGDEGSNYSSAAGSPARRSPCMIEDAVIRNQVALHLRFATSEPEEQQQDPIRGRHHAESDQDAGDEAQAAGEAPEEERRPSVSERAQLFMRLSELHRQNANPSPRLRDSARRERAKRFSTQPVTSEEVDEARGQLQNQTPSDDANEVESGPNVQPSGSLSSIHAAPSTSAADEDDEEPSQLSLAERVRLFNEKIRLQATTPPLQNVAPPRRRSIRRTVTSTRFRTLPVTEAEVEQVISPLAATFIKPPDPGILGGMSARAAREAMFEHASKTLSKSAPSPGDDVIPDSRPKGILKHSSSVPPPKQPLPPPPPQQQQQVIEENNEESDIVRGILKIPASAIVQARLHTNVTSNVKSAMKKESSFDEATPRSILKPQSIEKSDSSSSEDDGVGEKENLASLLHSVANQHSSSHGQHMELPLLPSSAAVSSSDECDTSSSGGREVKTIIGYISEQRSVVNVQQIKHSLSVKEPVGGLGTSDKSQQNQEPVIESSVTISETSAFEKVQIVPENQASSAEITSLSESEQAESMIKVSNNINQSSDLRKKRLSPVSFKADNEVISSSISKSAELTKARVTPSALPEIDVTSPGISKSSETKPRVSPVISEPNIDLSPIGISYSADHNSKSSENEISPIGSPKKLSTKFSPVKECSPRTPSPVKEFSPRIPSPVKENSPRTPSPVKDGSPSKPRSPLAERLPLSPSEQRSRPQTKDKNSMSIAERLAALKQSGETEWKKRVAKTSPDREICTNGGGLKPLQTSASMPGSAGGILAEKLNLLDKASNDWRKRVGPNDAIEFSVAGRMGIKPTTPLPSPSHQVAASDRKKKTPKPARFRSKAAGRNENKSQPSSPQKDLIGHALMRSISAPEARPDDVQMIEIPSPDNETFSQFFSSNLTPSNSTPPSAPMELEIADFEEFSQHTLLVTHKRTVKMQRRRLGSRNPVKALAARTDLVQEYQEVRTGAAEREVKRLNVEKLAKNSNLAVEALAGLASKEDFTAVALKKATSGPVGALLPYSDLMLLQIKGRRHVQTRLVEPVAESINHGDSYILVTPAAVYNWLGKLSNVIERTRSAEVALQISQRKDLGCSKAAGNVITIDESKVACSGIQRRAFWRLLGVEDGDGKAHEAGHPDEDESYENSVTDTNMVYTVEEDELVPLEKFWGSLPKIEMLDPAKVLVFDFGSELYVWSGKNANTEARKAGVTLARELWESGVDYSECDLSPLGSEVTGSRPAWALLGKLNQHMETALFREKFLDWPEFSRVIRVKEREGDDKQVDGSIEVLPCNVELLLAEPWTQPDLELEGSHLGRGDSYFDTETHRQFEIATSSVTMWHVEEFGCHELPPESIGHFHTNDSYVVRWSYSITVTGRELSGAPSKHAMTGRSRCAYFFWQGANASLNEQGAAALLTVELDREQGPQVRVVQGCEPAAFLRLFRGNMAVHAGHREPGEEIEEPIEQQGPWRLYLVRTGSHLEETCLVQVACSIRQLRSRTSLILINTDTGSILVWHGSQSQSATRKAALAVVENIKKERALEFGVSQQGDLKVKEIREGSETEEFFAGVGSSSRQLYVSLPPCKSLPPMRLFHLSSASGTFVATEILSSARSKDPPQAFPFLQHELYSASQPALFLLDSGSEMWLWQGWWAEDGGEEAAGSGAIRWQAERRAAMQTALDYWQQTHKGEAVEASLVWAGLEPLAFVNLFPHWIDRDDAAECNIQDGHKPGEVLSIEDELAKLTRSTYPPAQLLQRPLPDGVDPTRLEDYLSPQHFEELLGLSKEEFLELPSWKQSNVKKEIGLF